MTHSFVLGILGGLGTPELIIIVLVVLLLFGGKKIPELMRGIGKGVREFNSAKTAVKSEIEEGMREDERKSSSATADSKS